MARANRPGPVIPSNSLVASAVRLSDPRNARIYFRDGTDWQRECYRHYSICGEARYAARFMGNALSRAVLGVANKKGETIDSGPAVEYLDQLFEGKVGQGQMLEALGIHLTIAGECYLIGRKVNGGDIWEIVSVLEIEVIGTGRNAVWKIKYGNGIQPVTLTPSDVVIRIWNPKPGSRMEADSPFRSLLPILTEIEWLTRHIFAQTSSRLAGSGVLFLPQNMTFPPPPDQDGKPVEVANEADAFMKVLADQMLAPLADPGNVASKVPIIVTAPTDAIDKARLMQFWSELDANALEMRKDAIVRFAVGMDLPVEEILGMSSNAGTGGGNSNGVSHWGAWQIEESTIKMHIEPMLDVAVNFLTVMYLRPLLGRNEDGERVIYDTSRLKLRPDRSKEALELQARGLLKGEIAVVENGFSKEDMPDDKELVKFLLMKVAGGSATPDQVGAALAALGVDLPRPPAPEIQQPRESRPPPSLEEHPTRPRTPDESALLYACDALVWRALELAGKRVINAGVRGKSRDITIDPTEFHLVKDLVAEWSEPVEQINALLEGVFSHGPRVLGERWPQVQKVLTDYCTALIMSKVPHTRQQLAEYLNRRGVMEMPAAAAAPLQLTVNVNGQEQPLVVNLPEGLVASPQISLTPEFKLDPTFQMTAPEVHLSPEINVPEHPVVVNVEPTPVTVENNVTNNVPVPEVNVEAPTVNVDGPTVNVEAPNVTVEPQIDVQPSEVKILKNAPRKTRVVRDSDGKITGTEEVT